MNGPRRGGVESDEAIEERLTRDAGEIEGASLARWRGEAGTQRVDLVVEALLRGLAFQEQPTTEPDRAQ